MTVASAIGQLARNRELTAPPVNSADTFVALNGVGKVFPDGTEALRDVTLTVRRGEVLSILGPSGCGKSTLLHLLAGFTTQSSGAVDWRPVGATMRTRLERTFGSSQVQEPVMVERRGTPRRRVVVSATASDSGLRPGDIGFLFQDPALMPWASVRDNVALPLLLTGVREKDALARADHAVSVVGLTRFGDSFPRTLSVGMRMRAALARAIVTQPRVLLLDEPFGVMDEITRFRLNQDLLELWQQGAAPTIIYVTHSVYEAVFVGQRVIVMTPRPGRVIAERSVALPYPRGDAFRDTPLYTAHCRRVAEDLHRAMAVNVGPMTRAAMGRG